MTDEEIVARIRQGEDSRTQFKRDPIGVAKLAAELTAFTNAEGGVILFGVADDGTVVGLDSAREELQRMLQASVGDQCRKIRAGKQAQVTDDFIYANQLLRAAYPAMKACAERILSCGRALEASDEFCMPIREILSLI